LVLRVIEVVFVWSLGELAIANPKSQRYITLS